MNDIIDFSKTELMTKKKSLGQFFTDPVIADYMASLIIKPETETIRILDAGAGEANLTFSAALRCLELGYKFVYTVLYEIDESLKENIEAKLNKIQDLFKEHSGSFSYQVNYKDFILSRPDKDSSVQKFDIAIINPPYFKYSVKDSPYSKAAADLYKGDPNIYASFMAVTLSCLKNSGQMISITPRSFTNGLYFKGLRSYLLNNAALRLIHIFKFRDKLFKTDNTSVLQENIICQFIKGSSVENIIVRSSDCSANINKADEQTYSANLIIDSSNKESLIRIPESTEEAKILKEAENLETTFSKAGYFISTGPVVEFRTKEYTSENTNEHNSVPLYRPHNIIPPKADWTGEHKKDLSFKLNDKHEKHTLKNKNYVLLKRFSSKDEKRRLISAAYLADSHKCDFVGFANKTNYIGLANGEELLELEAFGLASVFNSLFMDKYFRSISGNTQVNATEVRVMKFPSREQIIEIGKQVQKLDEYDIVKVDSIVNSVIKVNLI